jgi:Domain of unknown function (DUF4252)
MIERKTRQIQERAMTKMIKTTQWALAMAMAAGTMATAQQTTNSIITVSGLSMQLANVSMAAPQVKDDLFAGAEKFAQGASEVSEINLDPSTMGMVGQGCGGCGEGNLASKMNFMVIHSYKYDKPGMYSLDDFMAYSKKLTDGTWNCYIHVREKDGSTDMCSRTAADHETNEMVILTAQPREITFIHLSGKMSLADLSKMNGRSGVLKHQIPPPPIPPVPLILRKPSPTPTPQPSPQPN